MSKKRWGALFAIFILAAILAACGGNGDGGTTEEPAPQEGTEAPSEGADNGAVDSLVAQGEEAYKKSCIACHGGNLEGTSGPALNNLSLDKDEIIDVIKNGRGNMPGGLAEGQEEAIAEYLLSQQ